MGGGEGLSEKDGRPVDRPLEARFVLGVVRDLLISALIGFAAAELAEWLVNAYVGPRHGRADWYPEFLSFSKMMAGVITGGLACTGAVQIRIIRKRFAERTRVSGTRE